jgi:cobalamin biosynthesis Mg chelatase CobN
VGRSLAAVHCLSVKQHGGDDDTAREREDIFMTALGVFRDDFYNAAAVLTETQYTVTAQASGTLAASAIAGARLCAVLSSGATALTTDTALNIIAQIQNIVATAYKQGLGAFAAGVNPPTGVPNLFNTTWTLQIVNINAGTLTLTAGAGVTLAGTTTVITGASRWYQVTITSPTTVTIQGMFQSAGPFVA